MLLGLKTGISIIGFLIFLAGVAWCWQLRDVWPRAASDPVPQALLGAIATIIAGLYIVTRGR
jgi:hypothetical protein